MKQGGTASKTCEKHGHSAVLQLSHSLLIVPFTLFSDNRDTGQLSPCSNLELGSYRELRRFFQSFFKSTMRVVITYLVGT